MNVATALIIGLSGKDPREEATICTWLNTCYLFGITHRYTGLVSGSKCERKCHCMTSPGIVAVFNNDFVSDFQDGLDMRR